MAGVATLVSTVGLASTLRAQVSDTFDLYAATEVVVEVAGSASVSGSAAVEVVPDVDLVPPDYAERIASLPGVRSVGLAFDVALSDEPIQTGLDVEAESRPATLLALSPAAFDVVEPHVAQGRVYDAFHEERAARVVVLGASVAEGLGITDTVNRPTVFIGTRPFSVVGILDDVRRHPETLLSVSMPTSTALAEFGSTVATGPRLLVETDPGATQVVAAYSALALRPDRPEVVHATAPPDSRRLRQQLDADLARLFVGLGVISLVLGGFGIANVVLVSVMQRVPEIGLRRAVGARPRHVAGQFLAEATILGTLGGAMGSAAGVLVTVGIASANEWTTVMDPGVALAAPVAGTLTGLLAGLYPARRAAAVEPAEALRS